MLEERPDPEELLRAISREEMRGKKGQLKIFLGMSAGVGKTYAMLEDAQNRQKDGCDVLVGTINTHGRNETAKLLEGLKILPEKWIKYKDTVFEELDIDEILRLKPQLVLIDELAHSNVPGSRHPKRWQDVMEILDFGINVSTTLNVQHIESLKDVIENIAGISIRETVPDVILESAFQIVLVDLTPETLLERLKEGKVYLGDQSKIAALNFFQMDRLTALREIALRFAAEKVDHDLHEMISTVERAESWKLREKLMVMIDYGDHAQKLIRNTRRLAFNLDAPWIALHVNDGKICDKEHEKILSQNLSMARELGAEVVTTDDTDILQGIIRVAKQKGVTQIVIGRSHKNFLTELFPQFSLVERLTRENLGIDVHVIGQSISSEPARRRSSLFHFSERPLSFLWVSLFVALTALLGSFLLPYLGYFVVGFVLLAGILIQSLLFTQWAILFGAFLSVLVWDYFFIPPSGMLAIPSFTESVMMCIFILTGLITGILIEHSKRREMLLLKREESTQAIYEIVRSIASAPSLQQILSRVKSRLGTILNGDCEILLKQMDSNKLNFNEGKILLKESKERGVAEWAFEHGQEAGWSTSTIPEAKNIYIPLIGFKETLGLMVFHPRELTPLDPEQRNFIYTVSHQLASYLQRRFIEERARKEEQVKQIEKIYQTILKTISREFYHPLLSIDQAADVLKTQTKDTSSGSWQIHKIKNSSENLIRIFKNISAMAKLSIGIVAIHKKKNSIEELVKVCSDNVKKWLKNHQLKVVMQDNLPLIEFDFSLMEILLYNLIFNAFEYSPPHTTIEIEVKMQAEGIVLSVADEGKGIPESQLKTIFEKFYRIPGTPSTGMGLGLAVSKTIAEVHGGKLLVENRKNLGAKFSLFLPK